MPPGSAAEPVPPFPRFESEAARMLEAIPGTYREGLEAVRVLPDAQPHPTLPEVFTLGECRVVDWGAPPGEVLEVRSEVILYHGSFRELAERDPDFDWEEELWETLTHELQHHLEFRADVGTLEDRDYADDQSFRRDAGEPFDPLFYRYGEPVEEGVYRVGADWYVEAEGPEDPESPLIFCWRGRIHRVSLPGPRGRVTHVLVSGLETGPGRLWVVSRLPVGLRGVLARLLGRRESRPSVMLYELEIGRGAGADE